MNEQFSIAGRVAVITGAGGVLGGSVARAFVEQGARVAGLDIRSEQLDARLQELRELGGEVAGWTANVLDIPALEVVAGEIVEKWGGCRHPYQCGRREYARCYPQSRRKLLRYEHS